ncbi:MAG: nitrous oxide reductase accessory protein NosL [Alphaproteobacteria bacterium]|uniref:Nitrous oxide reductase accessory protein NosL n=1 Tax=Candidatus Nitrobium versatile TaxID=2884831 RepID=A0A953M242_9BACT|nr:nitrous oxide reductase accessory protein NosL [Candidatus Nitrobium versatile]
MRHPARIGSTAAGGIIPFLPILFIFIIVLSLSLVTGAACGEQKPVSPTQKDKCAVCGMFVAKYPDWVAQILFKDGSAAFFDGPKDMFRYYFDMEKYAPSRSRADIDALYVKEYYSLTPIDAGRAFFVAGSDVYGPMGKELVPFGKEADAKEFMKDHKGKRILRMKEITPDVVRSLDDLDE